MNFHFCASLLFVLHEYIFVPYYSVPTAFTLLFFKFIIIPLHYVCFSSGFSSYRFELHPFNYQNVQLFKDCFCYCFNFSTRSASSSTTRLLLLLLQLLLLLLRLLLLLLLVLLLLQLICHTITKTILWYGL